MNIKVKITRTDEDFDFLDIVDGMKRVFGKDAKMNIEIIRWIPMTEKMPDIDHKQSDRLTETVMVMDSLGNIFSAFYDIEFFTWHDTMYESPLEDITYWMPLIKLNP